MNFSKIDLNTKTESLIVLLLNNGFFMFDHCLASCENTTK